MTPQDHRHLTRAHAPQPLHGTFEDTQPGVFHGDAPGSLDVFLIDVSEVLQAPSQLTPAPSSRLQLQRGREWAHRYAMSVLLSCSAATVGLLCWATAQLQSQGPDNAALSSASAANPVLVAAEAQRPQHTP